MKFYYKIKIQIVIGDLHISSLTYTYNVELNCIRRFWRYILEDVTTTNMIPYLRGGEGVMTLDFNLNTIEFVFAFRNNKETYNIPLYKFDFAGYINYLISTIVPNFKTVVSLSKNNYYINCIHSGDKEYKQIYHLVLVYL